MLDLVQPRVPVGGCCAFVGRQGAMKPSGSMAELYGAVAAAVIVSGTKCAKTRPSIAANAMQLHSYSITSSARASKLEGISRSSIRAVSALMTSSNLLACTTGKSAGFAPLRMRPV